jgi:hypothetical protein
MEYQKLYIFILNIILFTSCYSQTTNEKINKTRGDTTLSKRLEGVWAKNEKDNALFFIKDDSLYYIEDQNHPVSLTIKEDTFIINGDLPAKCKILKLTKDSLWFKDEFNANITKLYRRQ